ncbi:Sec1-like protein [Hyaloraphidium curvatum]|nr:Sec1-like protein [Hyaloraphidium curvatum]
MVDTATLKDLARRDLVAALDSVPGPKALLIDPELSGPLSLIAEFSLLKEHGVQKIYFLQTLAVDADAPAVFYLCRPRIDHTRTVASQVRNTSSGGRKAQHHLYFVPQRTSACVRELEEQGVFGDVVIGDYNLDLVPLERDVLSLEAGNSFRDLYLDGDTSCVYQLAKSILKLEAIYGEIPRVLGKGEHARALVDILQHSRAAFAGSPEAGSGSTGPSPFDAMLVFDRGVDLVTPLSTQLTYEGLIEETFGINATFVEVDGALVGSSAPSGSTHAAKTRKVPLSSSDPLFSQLRDMNFAVVGSTLSQIARRIHNNYEDRHAAKTMSEVRDFVGRLGPLQAEHQSLRLHTSVAEEIAKTTRSPDFNGALEIQQNLVAGVVATEQIDYLEQLIDRDAPVEGVLRLLALMSQVQSALKQKTYDHLRTELVQTYGFKHIVTLQNMERSSLLRRGDVPGQPAYSSALRKALRLVVDDVNEQTPNDISYVYSGFAPIIVRLVESAFRQQDTPGSKGSAAARSAPTWRGLDDTLKLVGGGAPFERDFRGAKPAVSAGSDRTRVVLVVFVGGCTYTEISALRFLSQQSAGARTFLVVTTDIVSAPRLLRSMML